MAITYWKFKKKEHLIDDDLIARAIELLEQRREKMAKWIEVNDPRCSNCGEKESMEYKWNQKICGECDYKEEYTVPAPAKGGLTLSRRLGQIIKELFGNQIRAEDQKEEPSKDELREVEFSLEDFSEIEYTDAERDFLIKRYNELLNEIGRGNRVDAFQVYMLARQELKLLNLNRKDQFEEIDALDRKRELEIYNTLLTKLKAAKKDRDDVKDKTILQELSEKAKNLGIEESVRNHVNHLKKDYQEYLEKSKKRREKVGNPY